MPGLHFERRMAAKFTRFEPARLLSVEHSRRKSVRQATSDGCVVEASFEQGVERNPGGDAGEDREQLPKAAQRMCRSK